MTLTLYRPDIVARLCELVSAGSNLNQIENLDGMPNAATVYLWLVRYPEFKERYEAARLARLETYEDEQERKILATKPDMAELKKLEIWLKKQWLFMEKLNPKKYGNSTTIRGDKDSPLTVNVAAALDHAIAQHSNAKTIEHERRLPLALAVSQPLPCETESIEIE